MNFRCYSQRLLNPFRGTMNIIQFEDAEAVTINGIDWDIYVRDTDLVKDLENSHLVQTSDIRYGRWSKTSGLKRGAIYPSEDFKRLEAQGAIVYEYLLKHHDQVPFPFADNYELWLLHTSNQPLALLNSCIAEEYIMQDQVLDWRSGMDCHSSTPMPDTDNDSKTLANSDYLTDYINRCAGKVNTAQWFKRHADGSGTACGGIHIDESLASRHLDADAFSPLQINQDMHDDTHRALIDAFIDWQAPCLLLLQNLPATQRKQLEIKAKTRALEVDKQHRLYPEIIDQSQINAARVEARLRRSSDVGTVPEEDVLSPEYIELMHPGPTD